MLPFPKYLSFRNVLAGMLLLWGLAVLLKAAWWLYLMVFMIALTISYFGTTQISSNFHMPSYCKALNHDKKEIAITFDDGVTNPERSHLVLDILKNYQIPATFFCIGKNLEKKEQIKVLKRMNAEGHIIGNHSYSHSNFYDFFPSKKIIEETLLTDKIIHTHTGKIPRFFRPPYGITTPNIAKAFKTLEHKTIGWSLRSLDTVIKDEKKLFERIKSKLKTGDIILFHDHTQHMKTFLPMFLEYILKEGYTVVGTDQLLGINAYA